jgi:hypothetical protein
MRAVRIELPSVRTAALERCFGRLPGADHAVLVGRVVDESGAPVLRAVVNVRWSSFSFVSADAVRNPTPIEESMGVTIERLLGRGIRETQDGLGLLTGPDGLFTFCSVPSYHTVRVRVSDGVREGSADVWIDRDVDLAVARVVVKRPSAAGPAPR